MPEEPAANLKPWFSTSCTNGTSADRTNESRRHDVAAAKSLTGEEAIGEAEVPELQTSGGTNLASESEHKFGRPASDVDHEDRSVVDRQRLQDAEMDEPRLFDAGNDLDVDTGFVVSASDELVAVLGFSHRARGHRPHRCAGDGGDLAHAIERGYASIHCVGAQLLHVART